MILRNQTKILRSTMIWSANDLVKLAREEFARSTLIVNVPNKHAAVFEWDEDENGNPLLIATIDHVVEEQKQS